VADLDGLMELDATAQAELVRRKEVTASELVEAAIDRIERLNPRINAVVLRSYERARQAAAGAPGDGLLAGVPYLLKDLVVEEAGVQRHRAAGHVGAAPLERGGSADRHPGPSLRKLLHAL